MIEDINVGARLDVYVAEREKLTRSAVAKYIENGMVRVNGKAVSKMRANLSFPSPSPTVQSPKIYP